MPGPELAVTLGELRKAFEQHCVSAAQIALELGVPPTDDDLYISWRDVVEAVGGMGLLLTLFGASEARCSTVVSIVVCAAQRRRAGVL